MGAVLGAVLGVALALIVEHAETSRAVAALGRERAAVLAASPPNTPAASRAARSQDSADGSDSSGDQRAQSAGRGDQRAGKADKNRESHRDKAGSRGKDKPNKSKGNDE